MLSRGRLTSNSERSLWRDRLSQHARWLKTVIGARSGDCSAIEEIFQEVALAVIKQNEKISDEKVAPWLYQLAVRQSLLYRRKLGRQRRLQQRLAITSQDVVEEVYDPLGWLLSLERQHLVRQALTVLNPKDSEILILKYSADWSYHDIAKHLGVSHSAVETRLHRARKKLRDALVTLQVMEPTT